MADIKGYKQMLLTDIIRVKDYKRTVITGQLTSRSDDPSSELSGWPASSLMMPHYIREAEESQGQTNYH